MIFFVNKNSSFLVFVFMEIKNVMSPPNCKATWFSRHMQWHLKRLWLQPGHCHIIIGHWCYDCHILPFVDVKVEESIEHVNGNEEEEMEAIG